jgi:hypothetical protein
MTSNSPETQIKTKELRYLLQLLFFCWYESVFFSLPVLMAGDILKLRI